MEQNNISTKAAANKSIIDEYENTYKYIVFSIKKFKTVLNSDGIEKKDFKMPWDWNNFKFEDKKYDYNHKAFFIRTGEVSNLTVIDFDDASEYDKLVLKFPKLLQYYTVKTRNGYHMYFLYCDKLKSGTDVFSNYNKIDILNNGKCVTAPPTTYKLLDGSIASYTEVESKDAIYTDVIPEYLLNELKLKFKTPEKYVHFYDIGRPRQPLDERIDIIKKCLSCLDDNRCDNYSDWLSINMIIKFELSDEGEGYEILDEWSSKSNKYDKKANLKIYNSIVSNYQNGLTLGSLRMMAKEDNSELYSSLFIQKPVVKMAKPTVAVDKLSQYEEMRLKFESNNFKLNNPISFIEEIEGNLIFRQKQKFIDRYENIRTLNEKGKDVSFVSEWFKDGNMRTYNKIDFLPKLEPPKGVYNTFTAFVAEEKPSNNDLKFEQSLMHEHILNLCGRDNNFFDYFIKFLALKVQKPSDKSRTSIIFNSIPGCGKDLFFNYFGNSILGKKYYFNCDKPDTIFKDFNKVIENKLLMILNEAKGVDSKKYEELIKNLITRETVTIEPKGFDSYEVSNYISLIFLSNNEYPVPIAIDDRRFAAVKCNGEIANKESYFKPLQSCSPH